MNYLALLNAIGCVTKEIADNGFGPPPPAPDAPTGFIAIAGDASVTLLWNTVTGATGYNVYRGTVDGGPYTLIAANVVTLGYVDNGLTNATTYYYVVTAENAGGESPNSSQQTATPLTTPEARYDASLLTAGAIVAWPDAQGAHNLTGTATALAADQNGLNTAQFNGTSNVMSGTLGTPSTRTVILACNSSSASITAMFLNIGATSNGIKKAGNPNQAWSFLSPSTSFGPGAAIVTPKAMAFVITATQVSLYYNGAFVTTVSATDGNGITAPFFLGAASLVAGFKACKIFEATTFASALSAAEIAFRSAALETKWALTGL